MLFTHDVKNVKKIKGAADKNRLETSCVNMAQQMDSTLIKDGFLSLGTLWREQASSYVCKVILLNTGHAVGEICKPSAQIINVKVPLKLIILKKSNLAFTQV